jgi:hypothetical protein
VTCPECSRTHNTFGVITIVIPNTTFTLMCAGDKMYGSDMNSLGIHWSNANDSDAVCLPDIHLFDEKDAKMVSLAFLMGCSAYWLISIVVPIAMRFPRSILTAEPPLSFFLCGLCNIDEIEEKFGKFYSNATTESCRPQLKLSKL